jgi:hypothetical protein
MVKPKLAHSSADSTMQRDRLCTRHTNQPTNRHTLHLIYGSCKQLFRVKCLKHEARCTSGAFYGRENCLVMKYINGRGDISNNVMEFFTI